MYVPMQSFPVFCVSQTLSVRSPAHVLRESSSTYRVHLSEHGPLGEELRLLGVHDDQVEERAPGLVLEAESGPTLSSA